MFTSELLEAFADTPSKRINFQFHKEHNCSCRSILSDFYNKDDYWNYGWFKEHKQTFKSPLLYSKYGIHPHDGLRIPSFRMIPSNRQLKQSVHETAATQSKGKYTTKDYLCLLRSHHSYSCWKLITTLQSLYNYLYSEGVLEGLFMLENLKTFDSIQLCNSLIDIILNHSTYYQPLEESANSKYDDETKKETFEDPNHIHLKTKFKIIQSCFKITSIMNGLLKKLLHIITDRKENSNNNFIISKNDNTVYEQVNSITEYLILLNIYIFVSCPLPDDPFQSSDLSIINEDYLNGDRRIDYTLDSETEDNINIHLICYKNICFFLKHIVGELHLHTHTHSP